MLFLKNTVAVIGIIVVFLIHVCSVLGCCHHFTICALFDTFLFHLITVLEVIRKLVKKYLLCRLFEPNQIGVPIAGGAKVIIQSTITIENS